MENWMSEKYQLRQLLMSASQLQQSAYIFLKNKIYVFQEHHQEMNFETKFIDLETGRLRIIYGLSIFFVLDFSVLEEEAIEMQGQYFQYFQRQDTFDRFMTPPQLPDIDVDPDFNIIEPPEKAMKNIFVDFGKTETGMTPLGDILFDYGEKSHQSRKELPQHLLDKLINFPSEKEDKKED